MRRIGFILGVVALQSVATPAMAADLPPTLADLLREATPSERQTIENVAKRLYPTERTQIDDEIDLIKDEEKARVGEGRFIDGWTGEISLGASLSTGNTDEWNFNASASLERKGPKWEHKLDLSFDLSDTNKQRTAERLSGGFRARRNFNKSAFFAFGSLSYERDRFQGIDRRFTETVGLGYEIIDIDDMEWEVTAGPAFRQTQFGDAAIENQLAAFLGTDFEYDLTDTITLNEIARGVFDQQNATFSSTTSITSNLYGKLSGKLSFTVNSESNPSGGSRKVDTYSRLSLVLGM